MRVFLEDVPERYAFYVRSGKRIMNVEELANELESMADDVFYHHVTAERNDFHNWVRDIVLDLKLAEDLLDAKTKKEAEGIIKKRIKQIRSATAVKKKAKSKPKKAAKKVTTRKKSKK